MVDWGPEDWGDDIDWSEVEQQSAKRQKCSDARAVDTLAAAQVRLLLQSCVTYQESSACRELKWKTLYA